jgi:hypothetical protein
MEAPDTDSDHSVSPGPALLRNVRAKLLVSDQTFSGWCARNGASREFAYQALTGRRRGPAASRLVRRLVDAVSLDE